MSADASTADLGPTELFAMTTEHSALQAARSATIFETGVRATIFLGAVSSGLLALAFLRQVSVDSPAFALFALVALPALVLLGVLTHLRLVELAVEDLFYGRAINRIRHYYFDLAPGSQRYFLSSANDDLAGVAASTGRPYCRWHLLSHAATTVLVVTSVLTGAASALVLHLTAAPSLSASAGLGAASAVAAAATMLAQQARSWTRADRRVGSIFPTTSEPHVGPSPGARLGRRVRDSSPPRFEALRERRLPHLQAESE